MTTLSEKQVSVKAIKSPKLSVIPSEDEDSSDEDLMSSDDKEWLPSNDEEWLGLEDDSTSSNRYGVHYTHTLVPIKLSNDWQMSFFLQY